MASEQSSTLTDSSSQKNDYEFNDAFLNHNMRHQSKDRLQRLNGVILKSIIVGGLYGTLFSIPSDLFLRWRSPLYRAFGFRIRVFYHTIWIASVAAFHAEKEVIKFENVVRDEEEERRKQLLELSVIQGMYTPESEGFKMKKTDN